MRLLIYKDLARLAEILPKFGVECKEVPDDWVYSRAYKHIHKWRQNTKKFNSLIEFKPDAVLSSLSDFGSFVLRSNIPLIAYVHGNYWQEEATRGMAHNMSFMNKITRKRYVSTLDHCMRGSTVVVTSSDYLSKLVREKYPDKPVYTLYLGIDQALWYHEKGMTLKHPCVGLVQNTGVYDKAQELHVLKRVMDKLPEVNFYWGGSGRYAPRHTKEILENLEKCPNFTYLGYLEYPYKTRQFYTEIDIYALLTGLEAISQTIKEAAMMGKPVIGTDIGGVPEAMDDGKTGFLVRKGVSDDIVDKISYLLADRKRASVMGQCGRDYVKKNFSHDTSAKKMIDILKEAGLWK